MSNNKLYMGIDVSKDTLDIYWKNKSFKIKNDVKSISFFIKKEIDLTEDIFCVMEPTGGYERVIYSVFMAANINTYLAHPSSVHAFAKAANHFAKTDKLDAILLYRYACFIGDNPSVNLATTEAHKEIIALSRVRRTLEKDLHSYKCRLKQTPQYCHKYIKMEINNLQKLIKEIDKDIDTKISSDSELKKKREIMISMKGIAKKTASVLLAELPELGMLSRRKISKLAGLAPQTKDSGKKSFARHIYGGRTYARKALYMPALSVIRHEPILREKYHNKIQKGKAKKAALVAIMQELLISLNAMIKKGEKCNFSD